MNNVKWVCTVPPLPSLYGVLDFPSQTQDNKQIKHQKTKGNYKKEMHSTLSLKLGKQFLEQDRIFHQPR